ncbi:MAG: 1,4-dihydroxy-2-naphthoate polyprenyltransferase [Acidimicrobiaceae bacterium]|nr:1,4-dihydroxy-2-naphthoate polyprenyltransferase [Acidimicrobiaceae bacterium]MCY4280383.1 1,4-dihydroxy-2-naphthoate polyprenyltransferase [Acidimicrobiaceae bacterium]MCY4294622.1 1,4-dihydroxy-2-naphthoate polyprenyltransferase [Acidimicrobiaceae bacterium]
MSAIRTWVAGARPRTLPAALVPVAVGAAVAAGQDSAVSSAGAWGRTGLALLVALALQVGVNFANDYSDGRRGTDGAGRVGPRRLVGSGLVAPQRVKLAAVGAFAAAAAAGTALAALAGWRLLIVGALCLLAGWGYTGGPKPYGYLGFGEVFVFVFFGLVATAGTSYVMLERLDAFAVLCGVPVGLWAVALLITNNLRDIEGDAAAGKITLAVRLGDRRSRWLYLGVIEASYCVALLASIGGRAAAAAVLGAPLAAAAVRRVLRGACGAELIGVLATTARMQLVSGLAMAAGIALTA